jgi:hypothetical protein
VTRPKWRSSTWATAIPPTLLPITTAWRVFSTGFIN